jgi:arabinofuranan 3-O-arabinosyltransferase
VVAYAVPSLVAALAVQTWFRGDAGLATGDLIPPVTPGTDYRAHWNGFDTGAGAPSYQIVSLPYFEGLRLFSWLGFGEVAFQRVWLTALVAGTAAAVVFLARGVVRSPLAASVAGFVPLFSAYRLTLAFDPVPLVAMIAAAVLGGLVVRAGGESGPRPLLFALASVCCGFIALNPPHLALVLAWIVVCVVIAWAVHGGSAPRRVGRFLLVGVPLAVLFNLWWLVPTVLAVTGPVFTDRFAAAGVEDWAWTHQRGNLLNVVAFTSSWAWPYPEYFPFSARLERAPFTTLQYVPAVAAVLGIALAVGRWRRVALVLAAIGVVAMWVMKGLHDPFSGTNRWFYDHVPGFWLLRDPAKTGLILALVFALLAAVAISLLLEHRRRSGTAVAVLVVAAATAYAHPLLTGAVAPTERPLLPSAHVRVPSGWQAAATYLETRPRDGKVVVLPHLDYYQTPTTWGYYGASFLHQLIDRPVIEPLPEGYYHDPEVDSLVARLQAEILRGEDDVSAVLQALGARYVVLRRDLDMTFPGRSLVPAERLARRLAGVRGLKRMRSFGQADVYVASGVRTPEVYAAVPLIEDEASLADVRQSVAVPQRLAVVRPDAGDALRGIPSGRARLVSPGIPRGRLVLEIEHGALVVRPFDRTAAKNSSRPLALLPAPDPPFALHVGSRSFKIREPLDASPRIAVLNPAELKERRGFFPPQAIDLQRSLADRVGDCHEYDERSPRDVGILAGVTSSGDRGTLGLAARDHSACIAIPVDGARPGRPLRIRLWYRRLTGNPARLCVWQEGPDRCAALPALDSADGWHRFDGTFTVAAGTESVRLFLYADGDPESRTLTLTEYRGLTVASPAPELGVVVQPQVAPPEVSYRRTAPNEFRVEVEGAERPFVLVAAETFAPGWRLEREDAEAVKHFRVNGYANGWRVPWTGSYELTISYGPERYAQAARTLDLVAVPLGVLVLLLGPGLRRRWGR